MDLVTSCSPLLHLLSSAHNIQGLQLYRFWTSTHSCVCFSVTREVPYSSLKSMESASSQGDTVYDFTHWLLGKQQGNEGLTAHTQDRKDGHWHWHSS